MKMINNHCLYCDNLVYNIYDQSYKCADCNIIFHLFNKEISSVIILNDKYTSIDLKIYCKKYCIFTLNDDRLNYWIGKNIPYFEIENLTKQQILDKIKILTTFI